MIVRFTESEANVSGIVDKVKIALGNLESYVITDAQGNEVLESEGTNGKNSFDFYRLYFLQMLL